MVAFFGLDISAKIFFYMMVSFSFFIGIFLMASPEAFKASDKALKQEYGLKTKLVPHIEGHTFDMIDKFILKNRVMTGFVIALFSFILLLLNRM